MATLEMVAARRQRAKERLAESKDRIATLLDIELPAVVGSKDPAMREAKFLETMAEAFETIEAALSKPSDKSRRSRSKAERETAGD
jgi:hypothetical protein